MNLNKLLRPDRILPDITSDKKVGAIRELAGLLEGSEDMRDFRSFLSFLIQEEVRLGSVVENEVAIVHCRHEGVIEPAICIGMSSHGIPFAAEEAVRILVLIAWPSKHEDVYLKVLGELARLLQQESVRTRLLTGSTAEDALDSLSTN